MHGIFFECYRAELKSYVSKVGRRPLSRTDVSQVTCPNCLLQLQDIVAQQLARHGRRRP
jgi:hypothetical protein